MRPDMQPALSLQPACPAATTMPRGGHFASLEEPELFLADVRAFAAAL
jgi:pimeloyl-ACP methyl ester carboxylesterase